jgi:hypothetical protein
MKKKCKIEGNTIAMVRVATFLVIAIVNAAASPAAAELTPHNLLTSHNLKGSRMASTLWADISPSEPSRRMLLTHD